MVIMAQYKVPQDVEAEDKFLGPLTFKQFLFGGATAITGYISFLILTSPVPFLAVIFLPFFIVSLVFTIPWSKDQPTDIFIASRIRFLLMKRKRLWDQSGLKDLVTITVPKREVHYYSDGLSQDEVRSRFTALSNVVDSRGWAVKNATRPTEDSDRLVAPAAPQKSPEEVVAKRTPDMLEERSDQVDQMIKKSENNHRKETLDLLASARKTSSDSSSQASKISNKPDTLTGSISLPQVSPQHASMKPKAQKTNSKPLTAEDEKKLLDELHKKQAIEKSLRNNSHEKRILTSAEKRAATKKEAQEQSEARQLKEDAQNASATPVNPGILNLSQNDDRSVASLAREVNNQKPDDDGEVVISLH